MVSRMFSRIVYSIVLLAASAATFAGPYDFEDDNKEDMASAFFMCAFTGFTQSECPSIFEKCHRPPLIWFRRHKSHFHLESHCHKLPSYDTSDGAANEAIAYADRERPAPEAYSTNGEYAVPGDDLVPSICMENPEICLTPEQEAELAAANCGADDPECDGVSTGEEGELPPICIDNPDLCDEAEEEEIIEPGDEIAEPEIPLTPEDFVEDVTLPPICEDNPGLCSGIQGL